MKAGFEEAYKALADYDRREKALEGFQFADAESRENAKAVMVWAERCKSADKDEPFRPPLILITGPMASGKTLLANRISEGAAYFPGWYKRTMISHLGMVAQQHVRVILLDGIEAKMLKAKELVSFITSREWTYRRLGTAEVKTEALHTLLLVAMNEEPRLCADMERRVVRIRLNDRLKG